MKAEAKKEEKDEKEELKMCDVHNDFKESFFCKEENCKKFICAKCLSSEHKDHKTFLVRFVDETAKQAILNELENATKKKAKHIDVATKMLSEPKAVIKGELEDIMFNSKYITQLRLKLKEYEKHNEELKKRNEEFMKEKSKITEDTRKETGEYQNKETDNAKTIARLQKELTEEKKKLEETISKMNADAEKKAEELKKTHEGEIKELKRKLGEVEEDYKTLNRFKQEKEKHERELQDCKDQNERLRRYHIWTLYTK